MAHPKFSPTVVATLLLVGASGCEMSGPTTFSKTDGARSDPVLAATSSLPDLKDLAVVRSYPRAGAESLVVHIRIIHDEQSPYPQIQALTKSTNDRIADVALRLKTGLGIHCFYLDGFTVDESVRFSQVFDTYQSAKASLELYEKATVNRPSDEATVQDLKILASRALVSRAVIQKFEDTAKVNILYRLSMLGFEPRVTEDEALIQRSITASTKSDLSSETLQTFDPRENYFLQHSMRSPEPIKLVLFGAAHDLRNNQATTEKPFSLVVVTPNTIPESTSELVEMVKRMMKN